MTFYTTKKALIPLLIVVLSFVTIPMHSNVMPADAPFIGAHHTQKKSKKQVFQCIKAKTKRFFKSLKDRKKTEKSESFWGKIALRTLFLALFLAVLGAYVPVFQIVAYILSIVAFIAAIVGLIKDKKKLRSAIVLALYLLPIIYAIAVFVI